MKTHGLDSFLWQYYYLLASHGSHIFLLYCIEKTIANSVLAVHLNLNSQNELESQNEIKVYSIYCMLLIYIVLIFLAQFLIKMS